MVSSSNDVSINRVARAFAPARLLRSAVLTLLVVCYAAATPAAFAECPLDSWFASAAQPADGATGVPTTGTLSWTTTEAADSFKVYFGPKGSGCSSKFLTTLNGGKTFTINYYDLAPSTTYEWRIEAVKNGCTDIATSSCMTFTTGACSSEKATLINPAANAGMADHTKVAFAWDPVFGATGYNVWVTTDPDPSGIGTNFGPAVKVGGDATTPSATGRDNTLLMASVTPGNHQWWVETLFPGSCPSTLSDKATFGTSCPTGSPQPQSPAGGAALAPNTAVTFTWKGVSGADAYEVWVTPPGGTAAMVASTVEVDAALAATSATTALSGGPGAYSWYVVAKSSLCSDLKSAPAQFTIAGNCPPLTLAAVSPNPTSKVDGNVTYTWTEVPNTADILERYVVSILRIDGTNPGAWVTVANGGKGTTATGMLAPGTYTWTVTATFTGGCQQSASQTFTVTGPPACSTAGPTLLTPQHYQSNVASPVNFSWSPVLGATSYTLTYGGHGVASQSGSVTTPKTAIQLLLAPDDYNWYVYASFDGCPRTSATEDEFSVSTSPTCPTAAPTLSPIGTNGTLARKAGDGGISFAWSSVPNASGYTVQVLLDGKRVVTNDVDANTLTYRNPSFDPESGTIEWYVTANYPASCGSVDSAHQTFTVTPPPPCTVKAPELIAPVDGTSGSSLVVTFTWQPVAHAASYTVLDYSDPRQMESAFGPTQEPSLTATLPRFGSHRWVVRVSGVAGCTGAESYSASFDVVKAQDCPTDKAQLVTPANNSTNLSNPVQFIWNSVKGATGYQLWVSVAGGAAQALSKVVDPNTTTATATLPEGDVQWYVKTLFPGCDPTSSDPRHVSTAVCSTTTKPQLLAPEEGAADLTSPVSFSWTAVPDATSYDLFVGVTPTGSTKTAPQAVASVPVRAGSNDNTHTSTSVKPGAVEWFVVAHVPNCSAIESAHGHFTAVDTPPCGVPDPPKISLQAQTTSGQAYRVLWTSPPNVNDFELEESEQPNTGSPTGLSRQDLGSADATFTHTASVDTTYSYRVRAYSLCGGRLFQGEYSDWSSIVVKAPSLSNSLSLVSMSGNTLNSLISQNVGDLKPSTPYTVSTQNLFLQSLSSQVTSSSKGYATVFLQSLANALKLGTNESRIELTEIVQGSQSRASVSGTTVVTIPVTLNVVNPIKSTGKSSPSASALVIPAVASTPGVNNAFFQSDVRLSNVGAKPQRYNLYFTPSGVNGTRNAQQTTLSADAGQTIALDDILKTWYGASNTSGLLEIRQLSAGSNDGSNVRSTVASSRTYTNTPEGTYGQYIPAVPFSDFVGKGETLTLLHLAQSSTYRTNLGLVEAAQEPATVHVTAYNAAGQPVGSTDINLQPGEQHQYNGILSTLNAPSDNARIDLQVTSATGRIMGYASVIDNRTNDPMLVMPVEASELLDNEIVIPGVADLDGIARWRTDVRVYNAGAAPVSITMTFYPSTDPTQSKSITQTINAGETKQLNDILRTSFSLTNSGGALHVTAPAGSRISASGRTYADTGKGTYGQFIPGVPHNSGITVDSEPLQILQLEESPNYRSNLGIIELTGKPVTVQITGINGEQKIATITQDLKPYQSVQLGSLFQSLFPSQTAYNARVSVKVISGAGAITAYGSVVDNRTQDPTYVPAQQ